MPSPTFSIQQEQINAPSYGCFAKTFRPAKTIDAGCPAALPDGLDQKGLGLLE
jgi:hypothetical protein